MEDIYRIVIGNLTTEEFIFPYNYSYLECIDGTQEPRWYGGECERRLCYMDGRSCQDIGRQAYLNDGVYVLKGFSEFVLIIVFGIFLLWAIKRWRK